METKNINIRIIYGIIFILLAIYQTSVTKFFSPYTGFDYSGLFLILLFLSAGIMQFIERKKPIEKKDKITILWIGLFVLFTISFLIYTSFNRKKQIEKMYQIEKSGTMIKYF